MDTKIIEEWAGLGAGVLVLGGIAVYSLFSMKKYTNSPRSSFSTDSLSSKSYDSHYFPVGDTDSERSSFSSNSTDRGGKRKNKSRKRRRKSVA